MRHGDFNRERSQLLTLSRDFSGRKRKPVRHEQLTSRCYFSLIPPPTAAASHSIQRECVIARL